MKIQYNSIKELYIQYQRKKIYKTLSIYNSTIVWHTVHLFNNILYLLNTLHLQQSGIQAHLISDFILASSLKLMKHPPP